MDRVGDILEQTPTIRADDEVIEAYADLSAACQAAGHPLQDKPHTGDRWIAACAIAKRFALLSGDGIFADVPNLPLVL